MVDYQNKKRNKEVVIFKKKCHLEKFRVPELPVVTRFL